MMFIRHQPFTVNRSVLTELSIGEGLVVSLRASNYSLPYTPISTKWTNCYCHYRHLVLRNYPRKAFSVFFICNDSF